jgi:hypothetical protein
MQFKLSEVKPLLEAIYNNPEIAAIDIPKIVNEKLSEQYGQEINLTVELVRAAYAKLGLEFKHRPRKSKGTDTIIFEDELEQVETPITLTNSVVGDIETEF